MDVLNRIPRGWSLLGLMLAAWVVVGLFFGGVSAVFAQEGAGIVVAVPPTEVVFHWGDWLAILLANLADPSSVAWTLFGLAMTWLVAQLPGPAKWAFNLFRVEQLLKNAITGAVNSTKGAVEGKSLGVDVGSEVFAKALQYAIDNGSKAVIDWAGGSQGIADKLIARIPTTEAVSGADLVSKANTAVTPPVVGRPLVG